MGAVRGLEMLLLFLVVCRVPAAVNGRMLVNIVGNVLLVRAELGRLDMYSNNSSGSVSLFSEE